MGNKNLILVLILSFGFLFIWEYFIQNSQYTKEEKQKKISEKINIINSKNSSNLPISNSKINNIPKSNNPYIKNKFNLIKESNKNSRIIIKSKRINGSISLKGGRIDDISLNDYQVSLNDTSNVVIFSPINTQYPYYADFGWVPIGNIQVPDSNTIWKIESGTKLTEKTPIHLTWKNNKGLKFNRHFSIDNNFLISITQSIKNTSNHSVTLHPYGLIARHNNPKTTDIYIIHEGLIGVMGKEGLQEINYSDLSTNNIQSFTKIKGWLGFTDKYFASTLIPNQNEKYTARFLATGPLKLNFQTDYLLKERTVLKNSTISTTNHLFVGAKEENIIRNYRDIKGFYKFDLLIDWGIFYFITKPLFWLLNIFNNIIGNFGFAILAITIIVKALFYPLANKSYISMSKMKKLHPEIIKLKERYATDRVRLQQAQMKLFKKEKINPMAGCWPMLIQIPVFFALYKVLHIAIEMRQAPFFGWIKDLSASDPTTIFNLFGLIPLSLPDFLLIGIWPILMGITQFIQMRLNPIPTDKIQAMVFGWMPVFFTFLLASFPAGMVIYWTWSNFLGIIQQIYIMKKNNVKIVLWDNINNIFKKKLLKKNNDD